MGKRSSAEQRLTGLGMEKRRTLGISGHVKEDPSHRERMRSRIAQNIPPPTSLSANDDWFPEIMCFRFCLDFLGWRANGGPGVRNKRAGASANAPLGGVDFDALG